MWTLLWEWGEDRKGDARGEEYINKRSMHYFKFAQIVK